MASRSSRRLSRDTTPPEMWVVAHVQATRAQDPTIRAAMSAIAQDETRHAELSWRLHRWSLRKLTEAQRANVRRAMAEAASALRAELRVEPEPELEKRAGVPSAALGRARAHPVGHGNDLLAELHSPSVRTPSRTTRSPRAATAGNARPG